MWQTESTMLVVIVRLPTILLLHIKLLLVEKFYYLQLYFEIFFSPKFIKSEVLSNILSEIFIFEFNLLCFLETFLKSFFFVFSIATNSNNSATICNDLAFFHCCS